MSEYAARIPLVKRKRKKPLRPETKIALLLCAYMIVADVLSIVATLSEWSQRGASERGLDVVCVLFCAVGFIPASRNPPEIFPFGWYWFWIIFIDLYRQDRDDD
jgi:hypothetical protein